jgi:hypothetical protein
LPDLLIRQNCDAVQTLLFCPAIILLYPINSFIYGNSQARFAVGFHVGTHVANTLADTDRQQQTRWFNANGDKQGQLQDGTF